jgi:hypothetical protein
MRTSIRSTYRVVLGMTLGLALFAGCAKRERVVHPLESQYRYVCCNLRYEKDRVTDRNEQRGSVLPVGTPVRIDEVWKNRVMFKPEDAPILQLFFKGREGYLSFDEYLDRIFLADDPRPRVARLPPNIAAAIRQATIIPGMTRDQVLMAIGYPPVELTPSLGSPNWRYFGVKNAVFEVFFDNDAVARVTQE